MQSARSLLSSTGASAAVGAVSGGTAPLAPVAAGAGAVTGASAAANLPAFHRSLYIILDL